METRSLLMLTGVCILALFGTSCRLPEKTAEAQPGLIIINVLDKNLYEDCHIDPSKLATPGKNVVSVNISMDDLEEYAKKNWDKEKTHLVVYCANYMCTASAESAKMLKDLGFKHVWAYEGGTAEWKHKGYAVVGACTKGYLNQFEKPEGHEVPADVPSISAEELKEKIEKFDY